MDDKLQIRLFGGLFIEIAGEPVAGLKTQKEALLLAYLVLAQRPFSREFLANLLWDERDQGQAMSNLRTLLSRLRKTVGEYVQIERQTVAFVSDNVWVDVLAFAQQLATEQQDDPSIDDLILVQETAVSLAVGDFLAGISITDSVGLENWQRQMGAQLRQQLLTLYQQLASTYYQQRSYKKGIAHARAFVQLDPLHEEAHRLLMRLLARDGQLNAALKQYQLCAHELALELGVEPATETQNLYGRLQSAKTSPPHHLPLLETSFVGRRDELQQIEQILERENGRLLTIVGMGGVGKTRLALQAANTRRGYYLHGIYFASLASVQNASDLPAQIAQTIGLTLENNAGQQQLLHYLADKEMLLLLDNIEHLLADPYTIPFMQKMWQQAPRLTLIITSRQALRLRSEWLLRLEGLPYPSTQHPTTEDGRFAALQLFTQRAKQQGVKMEKEMEADVQQVCQQVEGLPLAIELVTATLDRYSLSEIKQLIQTQLDKVTVDFHDLPARHRSIHAVFAYSWQLLSPEEQTLLGRLSLFQGQFSETAVTQITGASPITLQNLIHKSLLRAEGDGRFSFHSLIRQFITAKWDIEADIVQKHTHYYLTLCAQQQPHIYRSTMPQALQTIQQTFENIRLAWQHGLQQQQYNLLQNCLPVLHTLPRFLGLLPECDRLLTQAHENMTNASKIIQMDTAVTHAAVLVQLSKLDEASTLLQTVREQQFTEQNIHISATAIYQEAEIATLRGDFHNAITLSKEALALCQTYQHNELQALCYRQLGATYVKLGETEKATAVLQQALALFQQLKQPYCQAEVEHILGVQLYNHGQYEQSLKTLQQALTHKRSLAGSQSIAITLISMGLVANDIGAYDLAEQYYEEALQIQQTIVNDQEQAKILHNLGLLAQHRRQFEKAQAYYQRAVLISQKMNNPRGTAVSLGNLGDIAFFSGNYAQAKTQYAQGLAMREALHDTRGIIWSSCCNAVTANILGEYAAGQQFAQRAIDLAEELDEQPRLAFALTYWADARRGLGDRKAAADAYQRVLDIRQTLNVPHLTAVPLTRLGQLALEDEEIEIANEYVEQLLPYLQKTPLGNLFISGEAPLLCYQVLAIQGDKRADTILQTAHTALLAIADQFTIEAMRTTYLQNVLAHRRLTMLVEN